MLFVTGTSAARVDPVTGTVVRLADAFSSACAPPALAATTRHLLLTCPGATSVHDAVTLDHVTSLPVGGTAPIALPNGQVLMLGASGELLLFTPGPPA